MQPLGRRAVHWAGLDAVPLANVRDQALRGVAGDLVIQCGEQVAEHKTSFLDLLGCLAQ